jgi:hypothetical protein
MRKTFFKLLTVLVFGLFLFISCNKNQEQLTVKEVDQTNFSIAEAKQWYANNANNKLINFGSKTDSKIGKFLPLWGQSVSGSDKNYEVVETPLSFDHTPGFALTSNAAKDINGLTRLLVLKNKRSGEILPALMHIYSNSGSVDKNITYSKIPEAFTGNIFFTDLNGVFINGWLYENGKIVKKSNKQINAANPAGKVLPPEESCQTVETLWFERDCIEYYNGNYECGAWHFTYSTYHTYCTPPVGGGGGGGGGGYVSEDQLPWGDAAGMPKLCGPYTFAKIGNSYTASIKYLQQIWHHQSPPYESKWTNFVESCLTIPVYGITPQQASNIFNTVFNNATNTVIYELNSNILNATELAITARMKTLIQTGLQNAKPGSVWSTSLCSGNIPSTEAAWCQ